MDYNYHLILAQSTDAFNRCGILDQISKCVPLLLLVCNPDEHHYLVFHLLFYRAPQEHLHRFLELPGNLIRAL